MEYKSTYFKHIQPFARTFFVTYTLNNKIIVDEYLKLKEEKLKSLEKLKDRKDEKSIIIKRNIDKKFFADFDKFLDNLKLNIDLNQSQIADIIIASLHKHNGVHYKLLAYCIMSNHVHILIDTSEQLKNIREDEEITSQNFVNVGKIMNLIKGPSSRYINLLIDKKGKLWSRDYWDYLVRNDKEFINIVDYIKQNPVKAGLVDDWTKWTHTFVAPVLQL